MDRQELVDILVRAAPELENTAVKHIVRQAGNTPMFVCEPHGGTFVWCRIPFNHPDVKRFLRNREPTSYISDLPLADMRTWVHGFELVE